MLLITFFLKRSSPMANTTIIVYLTYNFLHQIVCMLKWK